MGLDTTQSIQADFNAAATDIAGTPAAELSNRDLAIQTFKELDEIWAKALGGEMGRADAMREQREVLDNLRNTLVERGMDERNVPSYAPPSNVARTSTLQGGRGGVSLNEFFYKSNATAGDPGVGTITENDVLTSSPSVPAP